MVCFRRWILSCRVASIVCACQPVNVELHPDNKVELVTFLSSGVLLFSSLSICFNSSFKPLRRDLQAALPKEGMRKWQPQNKTKHTRSSLAKVIADSRRETSETRFSSVFARGFCLLSSRRCDCKLSRTRINPDEPLNLIRKYDDKANLERHSRPISCCYCVYFFLQ